MRVAELFNRNCCVAIGVAASLLFCAMNVAAQGEEVFKGRVCLAAGEGSGAGGNQAAAANQAAVAAAVSGALPAMPDWSAKTTATRPESSLAHVGYQVAGYRADLQ